MLTLTNFFEFIIANLVLFELVLHGKIVLIDDAGLLCFDCFVLQLSYHLSMLFPMSIKGWK